MPGLSALAFAAFTFIVAFAVALVIALVIALVVALVISLAPALLSFPSNAGTLLRWRHLANHLESQPSSNLWMQSCVSFT